MFSQLEPYFSLLENYLLAPDKELFFDSLTDPTSKELLDILTLPLDSIPQLTQCMTTLNLNSSLQNYIIDHKMRRAIHSDESVNNYSLMKEIKDRMVDSSMFEHSKPAAQKKRQEETQSQKSQNSLKVEATSEQYICRKMRQDQSFIRQLTPYGLSKLSAGSLKQLPIKERQYFLNNCQLLFHYPGKFVAELMAEYESEKRKSEQTYELGYDLFNRLSREQFQIAGKTYLRFYGNQHYVSLWFTYTVADKLHPFYSIQDMTEQQKRVFREELLSILNTFKQYEHFYNVKEGCSGLRKKVIDLDIQLEDVSQERLMELIRGERDGQNIEEEQFYLEEEQNENEDDLFVEQKHLKPQQQQIRNQNINPFNSQQMPQQQQNAFNIFETPQQQQMNTFNAQPLFGAPQQQQMNVSPIQFPFPFGAPQQQQINYQQPKFSLLQQHNSFNVQQLNQNINPFQFQQNNTNADIFTENIDLPSLNANFSNNSNANFDDDDMAFESIGQPISNQLNTQALKDPVIQKYLKLLLWKERQNKEILRSLSRYIPRAELMKKLAGLRLEHGQLIENMSKYFSKGEAASLKNQRLVRILPTNKRNFSPSEDIQLQLQLKNVSVLQLKIYEINMEKHLLSTHQDIDDQVNLSFLQPTWKQSLSTQNNNPYQIFKKKAKVENIPRQMGVYVVDLHTGNTTSRAVIRKGTLHCIQKHREEGLLLSFLDEQGRKVGQNEGLRVWVKDRLVSLVDSQLLLDYRQTGSESVQVIASVGNYAKMFEVTVPQQSYNLDVAYIYNSESFLVGQKARVVLHPRLRLNDKLVNVSKLRNTKVKVTLTNSQNIKSQYSYSFDDWSQHSDKEVEFPIQNYTKNILIEIQASLQTNSGKDANLSSSKSIDIDLREGDSNFYEFYLGKDQNEEYVLNLRGRNGQTMANSNVLISYSIRGTSQTEKQTLTTDSRGIIILGKLSSCPNLTAQLKTPNISLIRTWNLSSFNQNLNYPSVLYCQQGEKTILNVESSWTVKDVLFYSYLSDSNQIVEDRSADVTLENGQLTLPVFSNQGSSSKIRYVLWLLPIDKKLNVQLLSGKKLDESAQSSLFFNKEQKRLNLYSENKYSNIKIDSFLIESEVTLESKENMKKEAKDNQLTSLTIRINSQGLTQQQAAKIRVHILPINYYSFCSSSVQQSFFTEKSKIQSTRADSKHSTFYNNKRVSEEYSYTQKRQGAGQSRLGNNLDKPVIFLKKQYKKDTTLLQEQLAQATLFQEDKREHKLIKGQLFDFDDCEKDRGGNGLDILCVQQEYQKENQFADESCSTISQSTINSHNNFLAQTGHLLSNLHGTNITSTIPKGYQTAQLFLVTPRSIVRAVYHLSSEQQKQKDLRHKGLMHTSKDEGWTMSRQIYSLAVGDSKEVSRDSQWRTVGLSDMFDFAASKKIKLFSWNNHLLRWHRCSQEKKKNIYDRECCHQLNTFLKFKDPAFFEKIVRPFLRHKVNKNIVDLVLLGQNVSQYAKIEQYKKLNAFQKALLVCGLQQSGDAGNRQTAERIVDAMEMEVKGRQSNYETFKTNFDTVVEVTNKKETPSQSGPITIYVKTLTGKNLEFIIDASSTVEELKEVVMDRQGIPPDQQRLIFAGKQLQSQRELYQYGITNGSTIHMVLRLRGGPTVQQAYSDSDSQQSSQIDVWSNFKNKIKSKKKVAKPKPKPIFTPVGATKEYTERTYYQVKNYQSQASSLVPLSAFWVQLSRHFLSSSSKQFISRSFMSFSTAIEFILMSTFVPASESTDYELSTQSDHLKLLIRAPLLLYVKELKKIPYVSKYGVIMNQRFYDPRSRYVYEEDGTQVEREVEQFIVAKPYVVQTIVTNTSGSKLQLQLLLDIPQGAIPLMSHEYTQILSIQIEPYLSRSFERWFYFPGQGEFLMQPSNACRNGCIISKATAHSALKVKQHPTNTNLQSLTDILLSQNKQEVLKFIETRNIFDSRIFRASQILWMLRDRAMYEQVVSILERRQFYDTSVWRYAWLHMDFPRIRQLTKVTQPPQQLPYFQYFPYFSTRTHQFANQTKSTIRNLQFKQTYSNFLTTSILSNESSSDCSLLLCYYLLLQDRLHQANSVLSNLTREEHSSHQLQFDYLKCYLDISLNTVNFSQARQISKQYHNYPLESWAQLFRKMSKMVQADDELFQEGIQQKKIKEEFQCRVLQEAGTIRIIQPANTTISVQLIELNLELFFSQSPFDALTAFSSVRPTQQLLFPLEQQMKEHVLKREDYQSMRDMLMHVVEHRQGVQPKKVDSFTWINPDIKLKLQDKQGRLTVFMKRKRLPGAYVKVFANKNGKKQFYRDGYTDITGGFKYVMGEGEGVSQFAILVVTEVGGITSRVQPPSALPSYQESQSRKKKLFSDSFSD